MSSLYEGIHRRDLPGSDGSTVIIAVTSISPNERITNLQVDLVYCPEVFANLAQDLYIPFERRL